MKTTQEHRSRIRRNLAEKWRHLRIINFSRDTILGLLDDADRCAELEETYLRLLTADRDAALARVKELEEGIDVSLTTIDRLEMWGESEVPQKCAKWWVRNIDLTPLEILLRALLDPKENDR